MVLPILKRIGIGVGAATLLVVAVGLFLPRTWTVGRTVTIDAPTARVHALCDDLEQWPAWTPWFRADPELEITMGAVTRGVGAHQSWRGKDGAGELTFTASDPERGIAYDIAFIDRNTRAVCTMAYAPAANGATEVTWTMTGDSGWNVMERYLGLLMDPLLGPMFEDGLERLKLVAEGKVAGRFLGLKEEPCAAGS